MTLTIDAWTVFPMLLAFLGLGLGLYERGQRKGLKDAEELYEPLIEAMRVRLGEENDETR